MILTCPQCQTSFEAPDAIKNAGKRKLKCSKCKHLWMFDPSALDEEAPPEPKDVLDDSAVIAEKNEEATVPVAQKANVEPVKKKKSNDILNSLYEEDTNVDLSFIEESDTANEKENVSNNNDEKPTLLIAALFTFGALLILYLILFLMKGYLVKTYPSSIAIYDVLGMSTQIQSNKAVINNVTAYIEYDQKQITVAGEIANLSPDPIDLLPMMAQQINADGKVLKQWVISPPTTHLGGAEIIPFASIYPLETGAVTAKIQFSLLAQKIANEDGIKKLKQVKGVSHSKNAEDEKAEETPNHANDQEQSHEQTNHHSSHGH